MIQWHIDSGGAIGDPMNRATRLWFLTAALELERPLELLWPEVRLEALNMLAIPGLRPEDYIDHLVELGRDGSIQFYFENSGELTGAVQMKPDDIWRAIEAQSTARISYGLTVQGGRQWEEDARPKWDDYVGESSDSATAEMYSTNQDRLIAMIGWLHEMRGYKAVASSMTLAFHENYQATYWKSLSNVYEITFQLTSTARDFSHPDWLRAWAFPRWYLYPWDHPEWPRDNITD